MAKIIRCAACGEPAARLSDGSPAILQEDQPLCRGCSFLCYSEVAQRIRSRDAEKHREHLAQKAKGKKRRADVRAR